MLLLRKCLLLFVAIQTLALLPSHAEGPGLRIAVCDLKKLYDDLDMSKDRRAELEAQRLEVEDALKGYVKKMDALKRELPLLEKGSTQFSAKNEEIGKLQREARAKKTVESAQLERKFVDFLKEFNEYVLEAITDIAKTDHYDFVVQIRKSDLARYQKAEPLLNNIFMRTVLFSGKQWNITRKVMKKLNDTYKKEKD